MKNFNNYADYVSHIENEINTVINELYLFKKTELNNGMNECKLLANLTFNLGSISDKLRGILNNQIPTQYELLDKLFNEINIHKLEPLFCIALLRYIFTSRYGMKEWLRVRNEIKHKLEKERLCHLFVLIKTGHPPQSQAWRVLWPTCRNPTRRGEQHD